MVRPLSLHPLSAPPLLITARILLLMVSLLVTAQANAAELEARVDRIRVGEQESVTLFLKAPGLQINGEPDLAALYQDFEILAQQTRTNIQIINGENHSSRVWEITLLPKRTGTLIIPAIEIGDSRSQPIALDVREQPDNTQASADVFLHSEIDHKDSIYVQQQLIYTLRLYYATSISDHGLTDLELDNVLMVQLGNRKDFEARIDGRVYNVAEWQFALYPQSSGELVIPPQTFSGRVRTENRYSLGGLKHVRIQSPEHRITVQPIPERFPADAQWLPAREVTLSQQWSGDYSDWQEGTPLTRQLTLEAEGLTAAQLPPLTTPKQQDLRQYPEQPKLEDLPENLNRSGAGLRGRKTLSIALIPTRSGELVLPEIRIPWWNTETDQLEYARLDALPLSIQADPNRVAAAGTTASSDTPDAANRAQPAPGPATLIWQISSLIFALISLLMAGLWWHTQQQLKQLRQQIMLQGAAPKKAVSQEPVPENPIFRQALLNACRQNQARAAWDAWQKWQAQENPTTTTAFDNALHQLQQSLFAPHADPEGWQGEALADASQEIKRTGRKPDSPLPNLYPDT